MEQIHYLDNSATTATSKEIADLICEVITKQYGNPSSLHTMGFEAEKLMTAAKKDMAAAMGCKAEEVYFTSGGTEANNWAIACGYQMRRRQAKRVITTAFEHSSVLDSVRRLETLGADCHYVAPDEFGRLDIQQIVDLVNEDTALVSVMMVNNEVGTVINIKQLCQKVKAKNPKTLVHCDAVQAFGKVPVTASALGVDFLTVTGHKIGAPKGIGALYIKKGVRLPALLVGGKQQGGYRPGTENVGYAVGMAAAAKARSRDRIKNYNNATDLRDYLLSLCKQNDGIVINSPDDALPYIINLSVLGIRSETLLHFLAQKNIFVSSGSACAKGELSHVLTAMKLPRDRADSALRISFGTENTREDCDALYQAIVQAQQQLARR